MQNVDLRHVAATVTDQISKADANAVASHLAHHAQGIGARENLADAYKATLPVLLFIAKNMPPASLECQVLTDFIVMAEAEMVETQEEETEDPAEEYTEPDARTTKKKSAPKKK